MLTICQHQATMSIHILNKTGMESISTVSGRLPARPIIMAISVWWPTGQRERAVHVNHHAGHVFKQVTGNQIVGKLFTRFHWSTV